MPEKWDLRREGRRWTGEEAQAHFALAPEKIEMIDGRLLWTDEERINLIAMLVENVGVDAVIRLGDTDIWREAITAFERELQERLARVEGRLDGQSAMGGGRIRCQSEDRPSIRERIAYLEGRLGC